MISWSAAMMFSSFRPSASHTEWSTASFLALLVPLIALCPIDWTSGTLFGFWYLKKINPAPHLRNFGFECWTSTTTVFYQLLNWSMWRMHFVELIARVPDAIIQVFL
jgi:hypothetical protein